LILARLFKAAALQRLPPILTSKLNTIGFEKPGYDQKPLRGWKAQFQKALGK